MVDINVYDADEDFIYIELEYGILEDKITTENLKINRCTM